MGLFKKKQAIDPVEFLVLRNELVELKERLDASEQAKASLEDRLSSLAATTMVLSSNSKSDTAEIVEKIESLENRLETTLAVGTKVDELHQRVIDVEQNGGTGATTAVEPRLAELSQRLDEVAELAAAPVAPDDELAGRLDALSRSAETVDLLQRQIGQINARMSAQADIADQVTALSDRIGLLQQRNVDSDRINQRLDELAAVTGTEEISERLALLGQRLTATEEAARAAAEQAATRAEIAEQLAAIEQRIAEATRPAAPSTDHDDAGPDDLDGRIAALVSSSPAAERLEARIADVDARLQAQADLPQRLAELDAQVRAQAAIAERLAELDAQLQDQAAIAQRVSMIDERLSQLASEPSSGAAPTAPDSGSVAADVNQLRQLVELRSADVAGLRELIDVRSAEIAEVRAQVSQLHERGSALPPPGADAMPAGNAVPQQLGELAERVALTAEDARAARERAGALEQRIFELDQATAGRIAALDDATTTRIDALDRLTNERIAELGDSTNSRIAALDEATTRIHERIDHEVVGQIAQLGSTTGGTDELRDQLGELWTRVAASEEQARLANEQAAQIGGQIAQLGSTTGGADELRDQLGELWTRVAASEEQARLANEQAAELARRLDDMGAHTGAVDQRLGEVVARLETHGDVEGQIAEIWSRIVGAEEQTRHATERATSIEQQLADTRSAAAAAQAVAESAQSAAAQANTDEIDRQLAELRQRIDDQAQLPDRLAELDRQLAEIPDRGDDIAQLHQRISELAASVPDTGGLSAQLTELASRVSSNEDDARTALRQALAIDERVQNVSTQLANQLGELSRDIDSIANREPAASTVQIDDEALHTLRSGQVKLAAEQARYEISFREDLAALAEQVRQLRGRA